MMLWSVMARARFIGNTDGAGMATNEDTDLLWHLPVHACAFAAAEADFTRQLPAICCGCSQMIWRTLFAACLHFSLVPRCH